MHDGLRDTTSTLPPQKQLAIRYMSELSGFYLDVTKDRLYTLSSDHPSRRRAQTVMLEILRTLTMAVAPIAPHTAQDIFNHLPSHLKKAFHVDFPNQNLLLGERKRNEALEIGAVSREGEVSGSSVSGLATSAPGDDFVFAQGWLRAKEEWTNESASKTLKLVRQARLGVSKCLDAARASGSKKLPTQTKASAPEEKVLYINSPLAAKVHQAF